MLSNLIFLENSLKDGQLQTLSLRPMLSRSHSYESSKHFLAYNTKSTLNHTDTHTQWTRLLSPNQRLVFLKDPKKYFWLQNVTCNSNWTKNETTVYTARQLDCLERSFSFSWATLSQYICPIKWQCWNRFQRKSFPNMDSVAGLYNATSRWTGNGTRIFSMTPIVLDI